MYVLGHLPLDVGQFNQGNLLPCFFRSSRQILCHCTAESIFHWPSSTSWRCQHTHKATATYHLLLHPGWMSLILPLQGNYTCSPPFEPFFIHCTKVSEVVKKNKTKKKLTKNLKNCKVFHFHCSAQFLSHKISFSTSSTSASAVVFFFSLRSFIKFLFRWFCSMLLIQVFTFIFCLNMESNQQWVGSKAASHFAFRNDSRIQRFQLMIMGLVVDNVLYTHFHIFFRNLRTTTPVLSLKI